MSHFTHEEYLELRKAYGITNLIINTTDACNLRCKYCFTEPNPAIMDLETGKQCVRFICDEFLRTKDNWENPELPCICFFGGEPLLRFNQLIKPLVLWAEEEGYCQKTGLYFSITTNGLLATEDVLKFMVDHGIGMLLSIDGDKETQDAQRILPGGSSFDIVEKNLDNILKYFPGVTFRSTVEPERAYKLFENYLFARNRGFKNYFVCPNAFADWDKKSIKTVLSQIALIEECIYRDVQKGYEPLRWSVLGQEFINNFKKIPQNYGDTLSNIDKVARCGLATISAGIACNGDIMGCQEHNTIHGEDIFRVGNIFTGLDEKAHLKLLDNYLALDKPFCKDDPSRCEGCASRLSGDCIGPHCPSREIDITGQSGQLSLITCIWDDFIKRSTNLMIKRAMCAPKEEKEKFIKYIEREIVENSQRGEL